MVQTGSLIIVLTLLSTTTPIAQEKDFYVSPNGNDQWSGQLPEPNADATDGPFATIQQARKAVRKLKAGGPSTEPITVYLRGGVYRLQETVEFNIPDSGTENAPVIYRSYQDEEPVLSAASPLPGPWTKVADDTPGLTDQARGHLRATSVPDDWPQFNALFDGDQRLPRARSRGFRQRENKPDGAQQNINRHNLYLPAKAVEEIHSFSGAEMVVIPARPWVMNILPMTEVDTETGLVHTDVPATYALRTPRFGRFPDGTLFIENVLSVLDRPGEWVLDNETRTLYLWPKEGAKPGDDILAPRLTEMVRVEGRVHRDAAQDEPAGGIVFRGLTFTQADYRPWQPDKTGWGLQHDWEMFDRPTAMLRFRAAENCIVENCRFTNSAAAGVRMDLHCRHIRVNACQINNLGGVGVLLAGYGLGTKDVNRDNEVSDCHIHHIGQSWWHSPAVFAWQSGHNRIEHNHIHHTPYTAIVASARIHRDRSGKGECSKTIRWDEFDKVIGDRPANWHNREPLMHGRENIIANNDIHHCMQRLSDGNAVYISGTGANNRVINNLIHDITSQNINANIRCDDDQHETIIENNIITRCCGEGFISKGNNTIRNNIVYDLRSKTPDNVPCAHQRGYIVFPYGDVSGSIIRRNIFVSKMQGQNIIHEGGRRGRHSRLRDCKADYNIYFCTVDPDWGSEHIQKQQQFGIENHSICAPPGFVAAGEGNFSLKADGAAHEIEFAEIQTSRIGPR